MPSTGSTALTSVQVYNVEQSCEVIIHDAARCMSGINVNVHEIIETTGYGLIQVGYTHAPVSLPKY